MQTPGVKAKAKAVKPRQGLSATQPTSEVAWCFLNSAHFTKSRRVNVNVELRAKDGSGTPIICWNPDGKSLRR